MSKTWIEKIYNNSKFQNYIWKDIVFLETDLLSSLSENVIKIFHHDKMSQLSNIQKLAFTEEQKSYMNADQLAAITVKI